MTTYLQIIVVAAFALLSCDQAVADTELDQFFPSNPIHEDDRLTEKFEAIVTGRNIELTEISGSFFEVRQFDVRDYETDPGRLAWPYGRQLSTRYNVAWLARQDVSDTSNSELKSQLRELRISLRDRRVLSPSEVQTKSDALENWLSEIRAGSHGTFARRNHTVRYLKTDRDFLVSVVINNAMTLPVEAGDMPALAHAMHRHSVSCE